MSPVRIVEPVVRRLAMEATGPVPAWVDDRQYATMAEARQAGLQLSCLRGTTAVTITGADGALLCSYQRADNIWRDLCRGTLTLTAGARSCSCGGAPTVAVDKPYQHEPTLGWYWSCDRCGAHAWSHVDPTVTDRLPANPAGETEGK